MPATGPCVAQLLGVDGPVGFGQEAVAKRLAPPRGQPLSRRVRRSGEGLDCPIGQELPRAVPYSLRAAGAIGALGDSQGLGGRGRIGLTLADAAIWVISEVQSGLPHSFPGATEGRPDRLAELTPIPEMADQARNVVQPPPDVSP